jgi:hypothetical protein
MSVETGAVERTRPQLRHPVIARLRVDLGGQVSPAGRERPAGTVGLAAPGPGYVASPASGLVNDLAG